MENILSLLIWIPILGAIVVAFLPRDKDNLIRYTSAAVTGLQFVIAIVLWRKFDPSDGSMQFMERYEWIPSLNISYICLLYTSPSPRDQRGSRMPSSA